jgi:putative phage-type endonuclease
MTTYISDLEDLEDILNTLVFEDEPTIFTEEYTLDLYETAFKLMEEYIEENPKAMSEPNFNEILLEEIQEIFYIQLEDHILESDYIEDDLNDLLEDAFTIFINTFHPDKSSEPNIIEIQEITEENIDIIEKRIQELRDIPQPVQRTDEWYKFRWNLITASNAWKAFESQSAVNQLIYEKCQPLKTSEDDFIGDKIKMVNTNTPLHWGQKYEPLSVLLYEQKYGAKVEDFGCIQHSKYNFIGASPDGIVVNKSSDRFGRMLEIKNVVSREITGIPKKEYWVQMQLQMEVCDLNECDFLETKFVEYPDRHSYEADFNYDDENRINDITISSDGKQKGIFIYFHTKDGKPFYAYKPLNITSNEQILDWEEDTISLYQSDKYNYTFLKFIYWKLQVFSCVLVLRKHDWFQNNIGQLEKVWKTIEEERVTGYEHRAPNKKPKKEYSSPFINTNNNESPGCLLKFNKIIKIDTEVNVK